MIHFGDNAIENGGLIARHVSIRGVVQGVGFRPFVYRLATRHGVAGWVLNGEAGVEIHAETTADRLDEFLHELKAEPPPAAAITACEIEEVEPQGLASFEIRHSVRAAAPTVRVSPDLAVCDACLLEMREPTDRRHLYPYINCTNCGPRYSIIHRLPYDRANTSMADWQLCEPCRHEYEDPLDRRYHAQPTACANCGPHYRLVTLWPVSDRDTGSTVGLQVASETFGRPGGTVRRPATHPTTLSPRRPKCCEPAAASA